MRRRRRPRRTRRTHYVTRNVAFAPASGKHGSCYFFFFIVFFFVLLLPSGLTMIWTQRCDDIFIVCCVFWVNFCLFGLIRSGALLYVALVDTFSCSHELASWPLSLAGATICMIGKFGSSQKKIIYIYKYLCMDIYINVRKRHKVSSRGGARFSSRRQKKKYGAAAAGFRGEVVVRKI